MARCRNHPERLDLSLKCPGNCLECGAGSRNIAKLCQRCSKFLDVCEICLVPAITTTHPAYVNAFKSPEAVAARKLRLAASKQVADAYDLPLSAIISSLIRPHYLKLEAQIRPFRQKLLADQLADPAYAAAIKVIDELLKQPYSEAMRTEVLRAHRVLAAVSVVYNQAFEDAVRPLIEACEKEVAPFNQVHQAMLQAKASTLTAIVNEAERTLNSILQRQMSASV